MTMRGCRFELSRSLFCNSKGAYRPLCLAHGSFKLRQIYAHLYSRQQRVYNIGIWRNFLK